MNDSKWTWRLVGLSSIVTTILLLIGFMYAVSDILYPKGETALTSLPEETQAPAAAADGYKILALGDSLAKGTGDNTGNGFVKRTMDGLVQDGGKAALVGNMGINGLTTAGLLDKLKEEGVQYAMRQANIVLLSVGGNDLFGNSGILGNNSGDSGAEIPEGASTPVLPETEEAGAGTSQHEVQELTPESLLAGLPAAVERLEQALESIVKINPSAHIYYIGLYNPFDDVEALRVPGNQAVTAWNHSVMELINAHDQMTLVPTLDLFGNHLEKYLSTDHFHPNEYGYQRISERIIQAVR
ncbi:GDSL-type esterase/lipase family protein [Paenibacillus tengchongensis]|uniref:GDSL-type esterase/lipase family protein n=1 Tax=Paenibacillus tengchongensis TaxID=2608684 RepID=UPI001FE713AC|nr:GDSL-type esterase/lipase family protein [Paenibacillus tengchongensis]